MNSFQSSDQADFDSIANSINRGSNTIHNDLTSTNRAINREFQEQRGILSKIRSGVSSVGEGVANVGRGIKNVYNANKQDFGINTEEFKRQLSTGIAGPVGTAINQAMSNAGISIGGIVKKSIGGVMGMFHGHGSSDFGEGINRLNGINNKQLGNEIQDLNIQRKQLQQGNQQNQLKQKQIANDNANTNKIIKSINDLEDNISGVTNRRNGRQSRISLSDSNYQTTPKSHFQNTNAPSYQPSQNAIGAVSRMSRDGSHDINPNSSPNDVATLLGEIIKNQQLQQQFNQDPNADKTGLGHTLLDMGLTFTGLKFWFGGRYAKDIPRSTNPMETLINGMIKIYEWERIGIDLSRRQLNELIKLQGGQPQKYVGHEGVFTAYIKNGAQKISDNVKAKFGTGLLSKSIRFPLAIAKFLAFSDEDWKDQGTAKAHNYINNFGNKSKREQVSDFISSPKSARDYVQAAMGTDLEEVEEERNLNKTINKRSYDKNKRIQALKSDPIVLEALRQFNEANKNTAGNDEETQNAVMKTKAQELQDIVDRARERHGLKGLLGSSPIKNGEIIGNTWYGISNGHKKVKTGETYTIDDLIVDKYKNRNQEREAEVQQLIKDLKTTTDESESRKILEKLRLIAEEIEGEKVPHKDSLANAKTIVPVQIVGGSVLNHIDQLLGGYHDTTSLADQIVYALENSPVGIATRNIDQEVSSDKWEKYGEQLFNQHTIKTIVEGISEEKEKNSRERDGLDTEEDLANEAEINSDKTLSSIYDTIKNFNLQNNIENKKKEDEEKGLLSKILGGFGSLLNYVPLLATLGAGAVGLSALIGLFQKLFKTPDVDGIFNTGGFEAALDNLSNHFTDLTTKLAMLNVPFAGFISTIGNLKNIIYGDGEDRAKGVKNIAQVQFYRKLAQAAIKAKDPAILTLLEQQINQIESDKIALGNSKEELKQLKKDLKQAREQLKSAKQNETQLAANKESVQTSQITNRNAILDTESRIHDLEDQRTSRLQDKSAAESRLQDKSITPREREELTRQIQKADDDIKKLDTQINDEKTKLKSLTDDERALQNEVQKASDDLNTAKTARQQAENNVNQQKRNVQSKKQSVKNISKKIKKANAIKKGIRNSNISGGHAITKGQVVRELALPVGLSLGAGYLLARNAYGKAINTNIGDFDVDTHAMAGQTADAAYNFTGDAGAAWLYHRGGNQLLSKGGKVFGAVAGAADTVIKGYEAAQFYKDEEYLKGTITAAGGILSGAATVCLLSGVGAPAAVALLTLSAITEGIGYLIERHELSKREEDIRTIKRLMKDATFFLDKEFQEDLKTLLKKYGNKLTSNKSIEELCNIYIRYHKAKGNLISQCYNKALMDKAFYEKCKTPINNLKRIFKNDSDFKKSVSDIYVEYLKEKYENVSDKELLKKEQDAISDYLSIRTGKDSKKYEYRKRFYDKRIETDLETLQNLHKDGKLSDRKYHILYTERLKQYRDILDSNTEEGAKLLSDSSDFLWFDGNFVKSAKDSAVSDIEDVETDIVQDYDVDDYMDVLNELFIDNKPVVDSKYVSQAQSLDPNTAIQAVMSETTKRLHSKFENLFKDDNSNKKYKELCDTINVVLKDDRYTSKIKDDYKKTYDNDPKYLTEYLNTETLDKIKNILCGYNATPKFIGVKTNESQILNQIKPLLDNISSNNYIKQKFKDYSNTMYRMIWIFKAIGHVGYTVPDINRIVDNEGNFVSASGTTTTLKIDGSLQVLKNNQSLQLIKDYISFLMENFGQIDHGDLEEDIQTHIFGNTEDDLDLEGNEKFKESNKLAKKFIADTFRKLIKRDSLIHEPLYSAIPNLQNENASTEENTEALVGIKILRSIFDLNNGNSIIPSIFVSENKDAIQKILSDDTLDEQQQIDLISALYNSQEYNKRASTTIPSPEYGPTLENAKKLQEKQDKNFQDTRTALVGEYGTSYGINLYDPAITTAEAIPQQADQTRKSVQDAASEIIDTTIKNATEIADATEKSAEQVYDTLIAESKEQRETISVTVGQVVDTTKKSVKKVYDTLKTKSKELSEHHDINTGKITDTLEKGVSKLLEALPKQSDKNTPEKLDDGGIITNKKEVVEDPAIQLATNLISRYEGFKPEKYVCPAGKDTIGFGFTDKESLEKGIFTRDEATEVLKKKVSKILNQVDKAVPGLDEYQRTALCSFIYNLGITNFNKSTLLKKLQERKFDEVPEQLNRWVYSNGEILNGLVKRRSEEGKYFGYKKWEEEQNKKLTKFDNGGITQIAPGIEYADKPQFGQTSSGQKYVWGEGHDGKGAGEYKISTGTHDIFLPEKREPGNMTDIVMNQIGFADGGILPGMLNAGSKYLEGFSLIDAKSKTPQIKKDVSGGTVDALQQTIQPSIKNIEKYVKNIEKYVKDKLPGDISKAIKTIMGGMGNLGDKISSAFQMGIDEVQDISMGLKTDPMDKNSKTYKDELIEKFRNDENLRKELKIEDKDENGNPIAITDDQIFEAIKKQKETNEVVKKQWDESYKAATTWDAEKVEEIIQKTQEKEEFKDIVGTFKNSEDFRKLSGLDYDPKNLSDDQKQNIVNLVKNIKNKDYADRNEQEDQILESANLNSRYMIDKPYKVKLDENDNVRDYRGDESSISFIGPKRPKTDEQSKQTNTTTIKDSLKLSEEHIENGNESIDSAYDSTQKKWLQDNGYDPKDLSILDKNDIAILGTQKFKDQYPNGSIDIKSKYNLELPMHYIDNDAYIATQEDIENGVSASDPVEAAKEVVPEVKKEEPKVEPVVTPVKAAKEVATPTKKTDFGKHPTIPSIREFIKTSTNEDVYDVISYGIENEVPFSLIENVLQKKGLTHKKINRYKIDYVQAMLEEKHPELFETKTYFKDGVSHSTKKSIKPINYNHYLRNLTTEKTGEDDENFHFGKVKISKELVQKLIDKKQKLVDTTSSDQDLLQLKAERDYEEGKFTIKNSKLESDQDKAYDSITQNIKEFINSEEFKNLNDVQKQILLENYLNCGDLIDTRIKKLLETESGKKVYDEYGSKKKSEDENRSRIYSETEKQLLEYSRGKTIPEIISSIKQSGLYYKPRGEADLISTSEGQDITALYNKNLSSSGVFTQDQINAFYKELRKKAIDSRFEYIQEQRGSNDYKALVPIIDEQMQKNYDTQIAKERKNGLFSSSVYNEFWSKLEGTKHEDDRENYFANGGVQENIKRFDNGGSISNFVGNLFSSDGMSTDRELVQILANHIDEHYDEFENFQKSERYADPLRFICEKCQIDPKKLPKDFDGDVSLDTIEALENEVSKRHHGLKLSFFDRMTQRSLSNEVQRYADSRYNTNKENSIVDSITSIKDKAITGAWTSINGSVRDVDKNRERYANGGILDDYLPEEYRGKGVTIDLDTSKFNGDKNLSTGKDEHSLKTSLGSTIVPMLVMPDGSRIPATGRLAKLLSLSTQLDKSFDKDLDLTSRDYGQYGYTQNKFSKNHNISNDLIKKAKDGDNSAILEILKQREQQEADSILLKGGHSLDDMSTHSYDFVAKKKEKDTADLQKLYGSSDPKKYQFASKDPGFGFGVNNTRLFSDGGIIEDTQPSIPSDIAKQINEDDKSRDEQIKQEEPSLGAGFITQNISNAVGGIGNYISKGASQAGDTFSGVMDINSVGDAVGFVKDTNITKDVTNSLNFYKTLNAVRMDKSSEFAAKMADKAATGGFLGKQITKLGGDGAKIMGNVGKAAKIAGKVGGVAAAGLNAYKAFNAFKEGNYVDGAFEVANAGAGLASTFGAIGGPASIALSMAIKDAQLAYQLYKINKDANEAKNADNLEQSIGDVEYFTTPGKHDFIQSINNNPDYDDKKKAELLGNDYQSWISENNLPTLTERFVKAANDSEFAPFRKKIAPQIKEIKDLPENKGNFHLYGGILNHAYKTWQQDKSQEINVKDIMNIKKYADGGVQENNKPGLFKRAFSWIGNKVMDKALDTGANYLTNKADQFLPQILGPIQTISGQVQEFLPKMMSFMDNLNGIMNNFRNSDSKQITSGIISAIQGNEQTNAMFGNMANVIGNINSTSSSISNLVGQAKDLDIKQAAIGFSDQAKNYAQQEMKNFGLDSRTAALNNVSVDYANNIKGQQEATEQTLNGLQDMTAAVSQNSIAVVNKLNHGGSPVVNNITNNNFDRNDKYQFVEGSPANIRA